MEGRAGGYGVCVSGDRYKEEWQWLVDVLVRWLVECLLVISALPVMPVMREARIDLSSA